MITLQKYIYENLVTNEIKYKKTTKFYHASTEKIEQSHIKDFPMFCFYDKKESFALGNNILDWYDESFIYSFNVTGKILTHDETFELIGEDLELSLVENPDEDELKDLLKKIKNKIKDKDVVGITIMDYSQINYDNDAYSILLFHPNKCISNWKKIKRFYNE